MTAGRLLGSVLVVGGILVATAAGDPVLPAPGRAGDHVVLAADLHVHSFFGDGALAPWEIVREARHRGLDVIAITNHNQLIGARIAAWSARGRGQPLVLIGQEITAPRFHMAGAGLSRVVDWRLPPAAAAAAVRAQGGVAIAAHPDKNSWGLVDDAALASIDGAEIGSPYPDPDEPWAGYEVRKFFERAADINGNLAPIGASDFHFAGPLGVCRTYLLADEFSERAVLEAIRQARTVSQDGAGALYGDPALVRTVEEYLAARPRTSRSRWHTLAAAAVLAGLALVVLVN